MSGKYTNPHFKIEDREITQYLLGELSDQQREGLESRLFAGEYFEQLERIEEDLIELYVRGKLRANEKAHFENHFMTFPRRRDRVEFTQALFQVLDLDGVEGKKSAGAASRPARSQSPSRFAHAVRRYSTAAVGLALLGAGAWLGLQNERSQIQQREPLIDRNEQSPQPIAASPDRRRSPDLTPAQAITPVVGTPVSLPSRIALPAFVFSPTESTRGADDSADPRKLVLSSDVHQVQLVLNFPASNVYRRFLASIQTPEGQFVTAERARLIAPGKVSLTLNADLLRTNDYILTLSGFMNAAAGDEIADYPFRFIRK
jgi:hypothetical protein